MSDLIPRNILLPIQDDSRIVMFQIDNLDSFAVDFEIFPTFGSKVIAKSVALPDVFRALESSSGSCCVPLFDPRLRAIGQIHFKFQVIKPYSGCPLEITHFATYWKATSALDDRSGLITGSSLSGDYLQLVVQSTRDGVPVVYPHYVVTHAGLQLPISQLSYHELRGIMGPGAPVLEGIRMRPPSDMNTIDRLRSELATSLLALQEVLANLDTSFHVNLHILYPTPQEESDLHLTSIDINAFTNAILTVVFDHARTSREQNSDLTRSIVFSSFNASICAALNWKQPNFPVLLCNDLGERSTVVQPTGTSSPVMGDGRMSLSIKESARLAQTNNFMGLSCRFRILVSGRTVFADRWQSCRTLLPTPISSYQMLTFCHSICRKWFRH